ncbi:MAG: hypothetical protein D6690_05345 [Nitrospirae bacterium]|nr:MAG: hypothetical protein D6690_05345 [Nitrospirota bacterium]
MSMSMTSIRSIYENIPKNLRTIARFRHAPIWMMVDEETLRKLLAFPGVGTVNRYKIILRLKEMEEIERANIRMSNQRTLEENRWLDEQEGETINLPFFGRRRIITLPDGRRAELVGRDLARPLCGLREPIRISQVPRRLHDRVFMKCSCGGFHLEKKNPRSLKPQRSQPSVDHLQCPRCKGQGLELDEALRAIHCITCGWYGFFKISRLSDEEIAKNEEVLAEAPARYIIEEKEEMEEEVMEEEVEVDEEDEVEDRLDQLIHGLSRLWMERSLRSIRNQLIERSIAGARPLLWAAVISFIEQGNTADDLVPFLSALLDENLADYAGFESEEEKSEFTELVERKLDQWKGALRKRISRFRSMEAGIRIIGKKFHPSTEVLRAVVG